MQSNGGASAPPFFFAASSISSVPDCLSFTSRHPRFRSGHRPALRRVRANSCSSNLARGCALAREGAFSRWAGLPLPMRRSTRLAVGRFSAPRPQIRCKSDTALSVLFLRRQSGHFGPKLYVSALFSCHLRRISARSTTGESLRIGAQNSLQVPS